MGSFEIRFSADPGNNAAPSSYRLDSVTKPVFRLINLIIGPGCSGDAGILPTLALKTSGSFIPEALIAISF
ncbi:hypothetical protein D3C86_1815850 [compost metagenome]